MEQAVRTGVCNFRAAAGAADLLPGRCDAALARLAALPPEGRLALLVDPRPLHRALFQGLAPAAYPDAAGLWRGTPGSSIAEAPRAVFLARRTPGLRHRDLCLPAAGVPAAMQALHDDLHRAWHVRPGLDQPFRDDAFRAMAEATARFFAIHPFMDGNGHVWRLVLPVLGARLGLAARAEWTVDRRPYGQDFSLALQWFPDHPTLLADQFRRWFAPGRAVGD